MKQAATSLSVFKLGLCLCWLLLAARLFAQTRSAVDTVFDQTRNVGYFYEDQNQLDSAVIFYEKALERAQQSGNQFNLATIYTDLAIIQRKLGNYLLCKKYHEQALQLAQATGDQEMVGDNEHGIGNLYEHLGVYDKAVEYYLQALAQSQKTGDTEGSVVTLQNISKTYMQLEYKELSLKTIGQALDLAAQVRSDSTTANVLHDYGEILLHFHDYPQALEKLTSALNTYKKIGYKRFIASSLVYIGQVYAGLGQPEITFNFFQQALAYRSEMDKYVLADMYFKVGNLYLARGKTEQAQENFERSLRIAAQFEYRDLHQKNAQSLYEIAKKLGKTEEALAYLDLSSQLKDTLFNVEKAKRTAEMQMKLWGEEEHARLLALEKKQYQTVLASAVVVFLLVIGFLMYLARVTARNNRVLAGKNREIQHQNIQLSESNEVLRQYAYVAAHDLKEPLRTICSFINLLEIKFGPKLNDPQATEYMQYISNSAKRMNLLLSDLLDYSSIFNQEPGSDVVDTHKVLDEVCINLQKRIDEQGAQIEYPTTLPLLTINRIHCVQIFQNLIGNALKFTPAGRRPVVQVIQKMEGREIVFAVKDNGIGIGEKHREKIFNLFFRAVGSDEYEGTGIGLSICKSLTEKYGGRIWFQSVENQGTTFFFSFPKEMLVAEEPIAERLVKTA